MKLANGIDVSIKCNKNTPRVSLSLNFSIPEAEKYAGEYLLISRLLLQGTQKYTAEELASLLEENAIELSVEMKYDYLRFKFTSLNEDFEFALSILADIIQNSTFEDFDKERVKLKGELNAELDSAKIEVSDLFTKTIYQNHYYGNSYTVILNEVDKLSFEDIKNDYFNILNNSKKALAIVGDFEFEAVKNISEKYLGILPESKACEDKISIPENVELKQVEIIKEDAQQAQIIQGWKVPTIGTSDYAKLVLLNVILGASGLSSRLFLELREKKGLAYTVRTSYELRKKAAIFSIYIGTEPSNITTSIEGFKIEIEKIKNTLVSDDELKNAKNNFLGRQQFITETNSQQANLCAYYMINDLPVNYKEQIIQDVKSVTAQDLLDCANKYFTDNYVISVIKP